VAREAIRRVLSERVALTIPLAALFALLSSDLITRRAF